MARVTIAEFARKTESSLGEAAKAIKFEVFRSAIDNTRVDTGRLKGNWQTTTGSPTDGQIERLDPGGNAATLEARANVTEYGVDYLSNNLPYAGVWNERDGIIARAMARVITIVNRVSRG